MLIVFVLLGSTDGAFGYTCDCKHFTDWLVAYASTFEIRRRRSSPAARGSRAAERERTGGLGLVPAGTRHPHAPTRGRSRAGDGTRAGGLRRARSAGAR